MKNLPKIAQILLGVYFLIFGLNGFLAFIPVPPMPEEAGKAIGAIFYPSYQMHLVKGLEVVGGLALIFNKFAGLALVILAVISVQIVLFHITYTGFVDSALQIIFSGILVYVMFQHREKLDGLLKA